MKFREGNNHKYGQDFSQRTGIPAGVDFDVERLAENSFRLTAPGYGLITNERTLVVKCRQCGQTDWRATAKSTYGKGQLYVWGLTKSQRDRFAKAAKQPKKYATQGPPE